MAMDEKPSLRYPPQGKCRASWSAWPAMPLCQKWLACCIAANAVPTAVNPSRANPTKRMAFSARKTCIGKRLSRTDKRSDVHHNSVVSRHEALSTGLEHLPSVGKRGCPQRGVKSGRRKAGLQG